jgi:hypothetical protein
MVGCIFGWDDDDVGMSAQREELGVYADTEEEAYAIAVEIGKYEDFGVDIAEEVNENGELVGKSYEQRMYEDWLKEQGGIVMPKVGENAVLKAQIENIALRIMEDEGFNVEEGCWCNFTSRLACDVVELLKEKKVL